MMATSTAQSSSLSLRIRKYLKNTKEQKQVVGLLVERLCNIGWDFNQILFGKREWHIPKSSSASAEREKGRPFASLPCDIAVFDSPKHTGDPRHLLFVIECKQPSEKEGIIQLERFLSSEPYVKLGVWISVADPTSPAVFVYPQPNGRPRIKRRYVVDLPLPGQKVSSKEQRLTYAEMIVPSSQVFVKTLEDLLDKIVARDTGVTRREEQLDQLCNLMLLKIESDKQAKVSPDAPPFFRPLESAHRTAEEITKRYRRFVQLLPDVFTQAQDLEIRFNDETIYAIVEELSRFRLLDLGVSTVSLGFQVLRTAALKQGEGQYFTPQPVIEAAVKLMQITLDDIVIDPACGTGGFLVETILQMQKEHPGFETEVSRWAQSHIYGIEKDATGVKLTKAIMQILGDGSSHCMRGDSIRTHLWSNEFRHLLGGRYDDGRFTVVVTNPPFGNNLKVSAEDARLANLSIAKAGKGFYQDLEIGLLFLNRAYQLLQVGGRVGIVLPETYFFSSNYQFLFRWLKKRLQPRIALNIPMEAFQGFCRAKTNFYVFEKVG